MALYRLSFASQLICIIVSAIHLIALAVSTYVAAIDIESILVSGVVCSITGALTGIAAIKCKRPLLAVAGFLTPLVAVTLFLLEAFVMNLGPRRAAMPFCIIFIINQFFVTTSILVELNVLLSPDGKLSRQITLKTLFITTLSFCIFFAVAKQLLRMEHDWLMATALGLIGITFVGLTTTVYIVLSKK